MFIGKLVMEGLPNIHPVAMFIMVFTIVYRAKALIPIGIFVVLTGVYGGFNLWWIPYLYIWAVLWGMTMLIPKGIPKTFVNAQQLLAESDVAVHLVQILMNSLNQIQVNRGRNIGAV